MNILVLFTAFVIAASIISTPVEAQNDTQVFEQVLEIVIDSDFPPYTAQHSDESVSGLFVDIVQKALRHSNLNFKMTGRPWKRVIAMTDRSELDASLPWRDKDERFEKYFMVGPIIKTGSKTVLWAKKDFILDDWAQLNDLEEFIIGSISGYAYPTKFEEAGYLKIAAITKSNGELMKLLEKGRFDLIIGDEHVLATEALNENLIGKFKQVGPALDIVKRYIAVPKAKKEIAASIRKALLTFQDTQQYQDILLRYK